jgi:hypothetical protein
MLWNVQVKDKNGKVYVHQSWVPDTTQDVEKILAPRYYGQTILHYWAA